MPQTVIAIMNFVSTTRCIAIINVENLNADLLYHYGVPLTVTLVNFLEFLLLTMGLLKKVLSKKKKAPTTQESIQKLRETEDLLEKKKKFLETKIEEVYCIFSSIED